MKTTKTSRVGWGFLLLAVATAGCAGVPRFRPFVEGFPPPTRTSAGASLPSAIDLPRVGFGPGDGIARPPYRIGPLDKIGVIVWGHTDLGSQVPAGSDRRVSVVREDGTVALPFLNPIPVGGKTLLEVAALVQSGYAEVLDAPQVDASLESCGSQTVEINGAILHPGTYRLCDNLLTIGELLGAAGGLTPTADATHGVLRTQGVRYRLDLGEARRGESRASGIILRAGDALYVPTSEDRVVYVFGEVSQPGTFPIPERGMSVLEAVGHAGGYNTTTARVDSIYLARIGDGTPVVYKMALSDLLRNDEVQLVAGDRVILPPSHVTRFSRWWRQINPVGNPERYTR